MSITSDEVNYLVYRYLLESGFSHSTFAFQHETAIHRVEVKGSAVRPGALISLLQKGLQYLEVETHIQQNGAEKRCVAPFTLLGPHECQIVPVEYEEEFDERPGKRPVKRDEQPRRDRRDDRKGSSKRNDKRSRKESIPTDELVESAGRKVDYANHDDGAPPDAEMDVDAPTGEIKFIMRKHQGPIFSLKWSKNGELILSGSVDKTAIVWDAKTGEARQQFQFHSAPTLDVDWRDDSTFATCSTDKQIYVCQLGSLEPLRQYSGHEHEVNAIKWDPSGTYLASCSDDRTAKIWSPDQDEMVWEFSGHEKEIYTMRWSTCLFVLEGHTEAVYSVSFSPNARYLASGSFDQHVKIWSMRDGSLLKTYHGDGGVFEVGWNSTGDRVVVLMTGLRD
nr:Transducin (beta)-like 1 X-linked receptor 1 [Polyrhizophydium stewartii]